MPMGLARRATAQPVWPRPRISSVEPSIGSTFPEIHWRACCCLKKPSQAERKAQHRAQHIFGDHVGSSAGRVGHRHGGGIPWPEMVDAGAADREPFHGGVLDEHISGKFRPGAKTYGVDDLGPGLRIAAARPAWLSQAVTVQVRMRVGQDGKHRTGIVGVQDDRGAKEHVSGAGVHERASTVRQVISVGIGH